MGFDIKTQQYYLSEYNQNYDEYNEDEDNSDRKFLCKFSIWFKFIIVSSSSGKLYFSFTFSRKLFS